jgi:hypothetical protein
MAPQFVVRTRILFALGVIALAVMCAGSVTAQDAGIGSSKPGETRSYRAGAKSLIIPPPDGDLVETGSDYRVALDALAPEGHRLIAGFILPETLEALRRGSNSPMSKYALVEVSRRAEFAVISEDILKQVVESVGSQFEVDSAKTEKETQEEINRRLKVLGSGTSVTLDKPVQLGTMFSKPSATGFAMIMPVTASGKTTRMVASMSVLRLHDRLVFAYLYVTYQDEDTVKWVRTKSEQWADAMLKANQ